MSENSSDDESGGWGPLLKWGGIALMIAAYLGIKSCINSCPGVFEQGYDRGVTLDMMGDKAGAIEAYTSELKYNPQNTQALQSRAYDYEDLGRRDLAIADLSAALQLRRDDWQLLDQRARVYLEQGAYDLAMGDLDRATSTSPDVWNNWDDRGRAHLVHGDLDAAIADYTRANEAGARFDNKISYYPRAIAYLRSGKWDEAAADFAVVGRDIAHKDEADKGMACAARHKSTEDCAFVYPKPRNLMAEQLLAEGAKQLSGCAR